MAQEKQLKFSSNTIKKLKDEKIGKKVLKIMSGLGYSTLKNKMTLALGLNCAKKMLG